MAEFEDIHGEQAPAEEAAPSEIKQNIFARFWKEWGGVVLTLVIVYILGKVVFQIAWVPSTSMETTIPCKSLQICWRLPYFFGNPQPKRGQVLTFRSDERSEIMVKRVIGLPGEEVSFVDGCVYIDGQRLDEPYLDEQGITYADSAYTVPEGTVFFLGDNRTGSYDARFWAEPYIPLEKLRAHVLLTFSFGRGHSWQGVRLTGNG